MDEIKPAWDGQGTGFVVDLYSISGWGIILTNDHVAPNAPWVGYAVFANGERVWI